MPDDETTTVSVSMAAYENQIANLQESIDVANGSLRALCELAVRTEEFSKLSGMAAKKWLVQRGYTDKEAAHLIASVIRGRLVNARPTLDRR